MTWMIWGYPHQIIQVMDEHDLALKPKMVTPMTWGKLHSATETNWQAEIPILTYKSTSLLIHIFIPNMNGT